ncbi:MAG: hypothetical protein KGM42_19135 [Hyphomicrobiales bacterium]|nr:hypothetical protein [Hyphomicrobiales bacterium]
MNLVNARVLFSPRSGERIGKQAQDCAGYGAQHRRPDRGVHDFTVVSVGRNLLLQLTIAGQNEYASVD